MPQTLWILVPTPDSPPPLFPVGLTCIIECSVLAGIEVDLTSFPLDTWKTVQGAAGSYYKVEYALEMSFEAAISFKVVCKGGFESSFLCRETSRGPLIGHPGTVVGEIVADYDKK